jgi:hypothetical protein
MARELSRDHDGTLRDLRASIQERKNWQRLGGPRYDALDDGISDKFIDAVDTGDFHAGETDGNIEESTAPVAQLGNK